MKRNCFGFTLAITCLAAPLVAQDVNVAVFGFAEQSTTGFGGEALRGIDGNTDGVYNNGSVTHTADGDFMPWWQVDLGDTFTINEIVLWNRTDCCNARLTNFRVVVLDGGLDEVFAEEFFPDGLSFPDPSLNVDVGGIDGQYVRVERLGLPEDFLGQFFLSLAEVQVFAPGEGLPPIILTQPVGGRTSEGASFEFSVGATGSNPLSYQWSKDGADLAGETASTLALTDLTLADAGLYQVRVSNAIDTVNSDTVELIVNPRNFALGARTFQSTTGFGGISSLGVDGDIAGASITHTADGDIEPWWEVELPTQVDVDRIVLWNRTNCCSERLTNFRVQVLDEARDVVFEEDFFTDGLGFPDTTIDGFEVEADGVPGRRVRITRLGSPDDFPGQFFLSLAEVEVYGDGDDTPPPPNRNLAARPEASVSQTSTSGGFVPELAVDGNIFNFTHTQAGDLEPAWEVDLGSEQTVTQVRLLNRTSCCGSRLRDITVTVLDDGGTAVFTSDLLNPENEQGTFPNGPASLIVDLPDGTMGRRVRVSRTPDEDLSGSDGQGNADEGTVLSLAEVVVFGDLGCPDAGDSHCGGITVNEPEGGGLGVYEVLAEGSDDSGDLPSYTFTATNGLQTFVAGPQFANRAAFTLGVGTWTITATVDDDELCEDAAGDASCEETVEVVSDSDNLALGKVATQSTTGFGGDPNRAIDGNTDGVYNNGSVTHTAAGDLMPSWEVDLLGNAEIDRIVLWNRTDCCTDRLTNFRVSVIDSTGDETFGEDFFTDGFGFPDTAFEGFEIEADGAEGSIVRVTRLGTPEQFPGQYFLSLAEVEVFGDIEVAGDDPFHRGDADGNGDVRLNDGVFVLNYLFQAGAVPACLDAADGDNDGSIRLNDGVFILNYLFQGGAVPPAPAPLDPCGPDSGDEDELDCARYTSC